MLRGVGLRSFFLVRNGWKLILQFCCPCLCLIFMISGESGGGYVCAGAMVQLASKDEGNLVKLAIPIIAMLDDYEFTSRESMTTDAAERVVMMQKVWQTIGGPDFENKRSTGDPLLFPGDKNIEVNSETGSKK